MVRTPGFQPGNGGSIPPGATNTFNNLNFMAESLRESGRFFAIPDVLKVPAGVSVDMELVGWGATEEEACETLRDKLRSGPLEGCEILVEENLSYKFA